MKRWLGTGLVLGLLSTSASAQLAGVQPVVEVGANLFINEITAIQSTISAINSVTELIPLEAIVVAEGAAEDLALIAAIIEDAQGLMQDLETLQRLFDPTDIPTTMPAMIVRVQDMNRAIRNAYHYALKTQTLVATLVSAVHHLQGIIDGIGALTGNLAATQSIVQVNSTMSRTMTVLTVQTASAQRPEGLEKLRAEVIRAMDCEIKRQYWLPYGVEVPC